MKAAIVAIEDRRFYQHQGVDWQGTIRAVVANSASGDACRARRRSPSSTSRTTCSTSRRRPRPSGSRRPSRPRPASCGGADRAAAGAGAVSKDEILTRYLNIVFWGNNAYGVAAAARTYFSTTADKLTVPQAALLAGMVRNTTAYDPVDPPAGGAGPAQPGDRAMAEQGMIDAAQAAGGAGQPARRRRTRWHASRTGCIGAGDAGFFCKYVLDYLAQAGFSADQLNRGGYTIRTTLDRKAWQKMKAALNAEVPPDAAERRRRDGDRRSRAPDKHRVLAMGVQPDVRADGGPAGDQLRAALRAGEPGRRVDLQDLHRGRGAGEGPGHQLPGSPVPPSGYASPIYIDGAGRPIPVQQRRQLRRPACPCRTRWPSRRTPRSSSWRSSPGCPRGRHGGAAGHEVAGHARRSSTRAPARRTDRSIAEVTKAQNQASFTLGVTPTSVLELANVGATLASGGKWCPPTPIESVTDPDGQAGAGHRGAVRAGGRPGAGEHPADRR